MQPISDQFKIALKGFNSIQKQTDEEDLYELYALYKQSTAGNATGVSPGLFDLEGKAKYESWQKLRGMSSEDAQLLYIQKIKKIQSKLNP